MNYRVHASGRSPYLSVHTFKSPWQAWLLILVLLYAWLGDRGIMIWAAVLGSIGVLYAAQVWFERRKRRRFEHEK